MKKTKFYSYILCILFISISCNNDRSGQGLKGFDSEVLKNWAENIIIPAYQNYQTKVNNLVIASKKFETEANQESLEELKKEWFNAYKAYQKTMIFDFGVSEDTYYLAMSDTYPTDPEAINNNLSLVKEGKKNEIDFSPTFIDSRYLYQGFPALDYLLYSEGKDLNYYQNHIEVRKYIRRLSETLHKNVTRVVNYWDKNKDKYTNSTDQSSSGEYSKTINAFIRVYEKQIRAQKVGYATGAIPIQDGVAIPKYIEAYYKGDISKELLTIALKSSQDFFNGNYFNGQGKGKSLNTILKEMGKEDLVNKINSQYEVIYKTIENTPKTLKVLAEEGVSESDFTKRPLYKIYADIQKNVGNYKTKMLAALNVSTNYQDTDGD